MYRKSVVLELSGRLKGEHLPELQRAFQTEASEEDLVLDLKELKLVDQEAVTFLASCQANGTELHNCPAYIREWIARERESKL